MSDEELLAQWHADRGPNARVLQPEEQAVIMTALHDRQDEIDTPKPLQYCETCRCNARGEHRKGIAGYLT